MGYNSSLILPTIFTIESYLHEAVNLLILQPVSHLRFTQRNIDTTNETFNLGVLSIVLILQNKLNYCFIQLDQNIMVMFH